MSLTLCKHRIILINWKPMWCQWTNRLISLGGFHCTFHFIWILLWEWECSPLFHIVTHRQTVGHRQHLIMRLQCNCIAFELKFQAEKSISLIGKFIFYMTYGKHFECTVNESIPQINQLRFGLMFRQYSAFGLNFHTLCCLMFLTYNRFAMKLFHIPNGTLQSACLFIWHNPTESSV